MVAALRTGGASAGRLRGVARGSPGQGRIRVEDIYGKSKPPGPVGRASMLLRAGADSRGDPERAQYGSDRHDPARGRYNAGGRAEGGRKAECCQAEDHG